MGPVLFAYLLLSDTYRRIAVVQIGLTHIHSVEVNSMPVRPRPFNVRCRVCDWTFHCRPRSDCYSPLEVPTRCKRCSNGELEYEYGENLRLKAFMRSYLGVQ